MVYSMLRNGSGAYNHVHENFVGTGDWNRRMDCLLSVTS